jgi:MFS family permease
MPAMRSRASYRDLFTVREYRAMFAAFALSILGDQVATIALTVLVYQRSGSPLLAAASYALVFLPWLVGGPILSTLADRWPRRRVMMGCDLLSFLLIGLAAIPGLPLAVMVALVGAAAFLTPLFDAARVATLPQVLDDDEDRYVLATSVTDVCHQASVLMGLVAGGSLLLLLSPSGALAVDAGTFLASALLVWRGVRPRPATAPIDPASAAFWRETAAGVGAVLGRPKVRGLLTMVCLSSVYVVVPEAVAVAFAAERGLGTASVGLLMAAPAAGVIVANVVFARLLPPVRRLRLMGPICLLGTVPLLLTSAGPGLVVSVLLFALAGAGSAGCLPAKAAIMTSVPDELRGRVAGVAGTALNTTQLLAIIAAGAAAEVLAPTTVVALAGAATLLATASLLRHLSPYLRASTSAASASSVSVPVPEESNAARALQDA